MERDLKYGSGDESMYAETILKGKSYVEDADYTLGQRDLVMCSAKCPCDVQNWNKWTEEDESFSTNFLQKDDDGVDDWSDCEKRLDINSENASYFQNYFDGLLEVLE
jgi:hypothetical protein